MIVLPKMLGPFLLMAVKGRVPLFLFDFIFGVGDNDLGKSDGGVVMIGVIGGGGVIVIDLL